MSETTQNSFDMLLKGGHVIDPKNNIDQAMDVGIADGKIARVAENIPEAEGEKVVHIDGFYVTPGLLDIHVHAYAGTGQRNAYCGDNSPISRWIQFSHRCDYGSRCWEFRVAKLPRLQRPCH